jgi:uncharacterized protein (DUF433 family)
LRGVSEMTITMEELPITIDPEIVSGTPVFEGTRVPVDALLNNLSAGISLEAFLDNFPTVTRAQAQAVLDFSNQKISPEAGCVLQPKVARGALPWDREK